MGRVPGQDLTGQAQADESVAQAEVDNAVAEEEQEVRLLTEEEASMARQVVRFFEGEEEDLDAFLKAKGYAIEL